MLTNQFQMTPIDFHCMDKKYSKPVGTEMVFGWTIPKSTDTIQTDLRSVLLFWDADPDLVLCVIVLGGLPSVILSDRIPVFFILIDAWKTFLYDYISHPFPHSCVLFCLFISKMFNTFTQM